MLTRCSVLFWFAIATALLAGCTSQHETGTSSPASASSAAAPTSVPKPAVTLHVAAAADLKFALAEVIEAFQKEHPEITVEATFAASGALFAQLSNKAPFDLFLSADIQFPRKLIEAGRADKESEFKYAIGHIVLWVPKESTLDVAKLGIEVLQDPQVKKIAIANPKTAPYGRAAEAALKKLELYDAVHDRLVLGDNVAQTAQFVQSGAADVGIIALSLALAPPMKDKGKYWEVPPDAYPTLEQGGVILEHSTQKPAAQEFRKHLMSAPAKEVLKRYGFVSPG